MTISKKLLMAALVATGFANVQAITLAGFNMDLLKPLNVQTAQAFANVESTMEATRGVYVSGKDYLKAVYNRKKEQTKQIYAGLKNDYKLARANGDATWFVKKQTYKAYKKFIYSVWKKTGSLPVL